MEKGDKKKLAFTLAEVLITLGIIGIVAALTIPSLMSNYRKKVIETRLSKFYATINNAIKLAEYDYDDRTGWDELGSGFIKDENGKDTATPKAEAWVNKYLVPYIKGDTKMTNKNGCIELYFQDGSMVAINSAGYFTLTHKSINSLKMEVLTKEKQGKISLSFYIIQVALRIKKIKLVNILERVLNHTNGIGTEQEKAYLMVGMGVAKPNQVVRMHIVQN